MSFCLSCVQWLISPVDVETFYEAIHDDEPLLVTRPTNRAYFEGLFSKQGALRVCVYVPSAMSLRCCVLNPGSSVGRGSKHFGLCACCLMARFIEPGVNHGVSCWLHAEIDKLLRGGSLQYLFNVDVTSFSAGGSKRQDFNYNGDAAPEEGAGGAPCQQTGKWAGQQPTTWQKWNRVRENVMDVHSNNAYKLLLACGVQCQKWRMPMWWSGGLRRRAAACACCTRSGFATRCGAWWRAWRASCSAPSAATRTSRPQAPRALRRTGERAVG